MLGRKLFRPASYMSKLNLLEKTFLILEGVSGSHHISKNLERQIVFLRKTESNLELGESWQPWAIFQFPFFGQVDNKE